jgi:hypothetical protein
MASLDGSALLPLSLLSTLGALSLALLARRQSKWRGERCAPRPVAHWLRESRGGERENALRERKKGDVLRSSLARFDESRFFFFFFFF